MWVLLIGSAYVLAASAWNFGILTAYVKFFELKDNDRSLYEKMYGLAFLPFHWPFVLVKRLFRVKVG